MKTFAHNTTFAFIMTLASAGLTGCLEAGDAGMNAAEYNAIAVAMGAIVADADHGQPEAFADTADLARGVVPRDFEMAGEIAYADRSGLSYSVAAVCSDALGRGALCGEGAALAHIAASWSGEWEGGGGDIASEFDANWTFDLTRSVLAGHAAATALIAGRRLDYTARYADVVIAQGQPVAGVVSYDIVVERDVDGAKVKVAMNGELAFAPDGNATLTLDGAHTYRAFADGSVTRVP